MGVGKSRVHPQTRVTTKFLPTPGKIENTWEANPATQRCAHDLDKVCCGFEKLPRWTGVSPKASKFFVANARTVCFAIVNLDRSSVEFHAIHPARQ